MPGEQGRRPLAVVTGGAGDVGSVTAAHLIGAGWQVVLADHDSAAAERVVGDLGPHATAVTIDLADDDSIARFAETVAPFRPTALVSCAGAVVVRPFLASTTEERDHLLDVNLRGPMQLTHALLPALIAEESPRIVYVASDSARAGAAEEAPYAASKAGLLGLAKSLAREHARDDLTANVVCPGPIDGPMVAATMAGKASMLEKLASAIPLRRLAGAADVAAAIGWLCSPEASYVTGQTLSVSGGLTMH